MSARFGRVSTLLAAGALLAGVGAGVAPWLDLARAQERAAQRSFSVSARKYAYDPPRIEVTQNDLVKITFRAEDVPHSFTIDAYRISKRAGAGETVTFEFRADSPGTFTYYCDLRADDGCRKMRGELVVKP